MKKTLICGIGGTIAGIIGGGYMGARLTCNIIGTKIEENGGKEKLDEFVSLIKKKEEPD